MPLWRLFYHVVFATKGRQPALSPGLRTEVCRLLLLKAEELDCIVHAVHAQPEHVHVALSIPPARAVATVIGQMKGSASHGLRALYPEAAAFTWQDSYGVFSFGERNLSDVIRYVEEQESRHAEGKVWALLERTGDDATVERPPIAADASVAGPPAAQAAGLRGVKPAEAGYDATGTVGPSRLRPALPHVSHTLEGVASPPTADAPPVADGGGAAHQPAHAPFTSVLEALTGEDA